MAANCCEHCDSASEDHDILIEIRTGMKSCLAALSDHETRLRRTERWGFLALGFLFALQTIIGIVLAVRFSK